MRSAFDAIDLLVETIRASGAAAGRPDLQVSFGHPGRDLALVGVIVGETIEDAEREAASLGPPGMFAQTDERYTVSITAEVAIAGGSAREAAEEAAAIADVVVDASDTITNAAPAWLLTLRIRRAQLRNTFSGDGRSSIYRLEADVHARVP